MVLRQFEGYNIDPSCYFSTDRYRNTNSPLPPSTSNLPIPIIGGITISYRQLFLSTISFYGIGIQDSIKLGFKCPNCGTEWQAIKQAPSTINEVAIFQCPRCLKNIGLLLAVTSVDDFAIQCSD